MSGWKFIASLILRYRIPILIVVALATGFMYVNRGTERMHDFGKIIPKNDPDYIEYQDFREEFGDDGNVLVIGYDGDILDKKFFNGLFRLSESLKQVDGVTGVISIANISRIVVDQENESFGVERVASAEAKDEFEMDSLRKILSGLPFYKGLLISPDLKSTILGVTIDSKRLDTQEKTVIVGNITSLAEETGKEIKSGPHFSGLPFIRAFVTEFIPREMYFFLGVAVLVMAIALFITFRSMTAVVVPLLVIGIVIVWSMGILGLLGYKITILTGILPALIAVIGVPNSIYLLTKYHFEYKKSNNKIRALINVIQKIGIVTVMTNATTAVGFGVLAFTKIQMLKEFGILAGLSVVVTFFVSLLLIPIIFSYLPAPKPRHVKHTERKSLQGAIKLLDKIVIKKRWLVYVLTLIMVGVSIWGTTQLEPRAFMVDDLPREERVIPDLEFLEDRFGGVMPFEILINTHRKQGIYRRSNLKRMEKFQDRMTHYPELSKSLSVLDMVKFGRQALFSGVEKEYQLPSSEEYVIIQSYLKNSKQDTLFSQAKISDKEGRTARIKASVKDIGAQKMTPLIDSLTVDLVNAFVVNTKSGRLKEGEQYRLWGETDSFRVKYNGEEYLNGQIFAVKDSIREYEILGGNGKIDYSDRVTITGTTKIFLRSNEFLISNLLQSLLIAFVVIAFLMALLFGSLKMVFIALLPNFLPLLLTAGIMGFVDIAIKPSTALIFSVAFGIAVDDTIHFLARFRQARKSGDGIEAAVSNSFKDTGVSMIYTSIILFFGFVIFAFSSYGGTEALGQLTSLTLLIALFTNLLLLPSLLISLTKDTDKIGKSWIGAKFDSDEDE